MRSRLSVTLTLNTTSRSTSLPFGAFLRRENNRMRKDDDEKRQQRAARAKGHRCRMHGGASPGAPCEEHNGNYRSGFWTKKAKRERRAARAIRASLITLIDELTW